MFSNATLLTFDTGALKSDILHDAVLVTRAGEIEAIAGVHDVVIPYGATVLDVQGGDECLRLLCLRRLINVPWLGFIVPGFIDVHAHWNGFITTYPARSWEMETFLAYGVTTLHK